MRQDADSYSFPGVFAPVLSLEELASRLDPETGVDTFDIRDDSLPVDAQVERAQAFEAVAHFIASLPPRDRDMVRRYFWEEETQTQIACDLGVSKMAVSKALARVARKGRQELAAHVHLAFMN